MSVTDLHPERVGELPVPAVDTKPTNVVAALAAVMRDLPGIGRDNTSGQGYNYRGLESITAEAQKLLGRYCVVFVPEVLERDVRDLTVNGKPWTDDVLKVQYKVYGPGGTDDMIVVGPIYGIGRDNSDKGSNKAMSQAYKYALLQTLCIGDAKDDGDRDHANEADAPPTQDAPNWFEENGWKSKDEYDVAVAALVDLVKSDKLNEIGREDLRQWMAAADLSFKRPLRRAEVDTIQSKAEDLAGMNEPFPPAPPEGSEPQYTPDEQPF